MNCIGADLSFSPASSPGGLTLQSDVGTSTNLDAVEIQITFGVAVTGFDKSLISLSLASHVNSSLGELLVHNQAFGIFSIRVYDIQGQGTFTLFINTTNVTDAVSRTFEPAHITVLHDTEVEGPSISAAAISNVERLRVSVDFNEPVNRRLSLNDFALRWSPSEKKTAIFPATLGDLVVVDAKLGRFELWVSNFIGEGEMNIFFSSLTAADRAGNHFPNASFSFVHDVSPPLPVLSSNSAFTNANYVLVEVTFGETISAPITSDQLLLEGEVNAKIDITEGDLQTGDFSLRVYDLSGDGVFTITVPAGCTTDLVFT